ncbi:MAG: DUF2157 domain-containing protein [Candidatus Vogelbacteria bacterium]|nr:DUF2157 domain-containing protein [Candidatus Vogelbacteria bacterium]
MSQDINSQVGALLASGKTKDEIYRDLLVQGFTLQQVEGAYVGLTAGAKKADSAKRTVAIITVFGAIMIGAGVFSFIAANWQGMTAALKVSLLVAGVIIFHLLGVVFTEKLSFPKVGEAFHLLGTITFGAGVFLVAQIYNIRANWPDGFILWYFGALAAAYALDSYYQWIIAIMLAIVSLVGYPAMIAGSFFGAGGDPFALTSPILLSVATVITAIVGIVLRRKHFAEVSIT